MNPHRNKGCWFSQNLFLSLTINLKYLNDKMLEKLVIFKRLIGLKKLNEFHSYYFRIHTRSLLQNHLKNLDKLLSSDRLLLKVIREFFHQIIINVLHTISRTLNKYFHGPIKIHVNEFQISGTMPRSYYFKSQLISCPKWS